MKVQKIPNIVVVLILTLVTVIMWISLAVYGAFTTKPPITVPREISEPLNPSLDSDTLKQIESRIFLNDSEIPDNVVFINPTVTTFSTLSPAPLRQEISSSSATPLP